MYVGLDVHKDFCQAAFLDVDGKVVKEKRFENTVSGLKELPRQQKARKLSWNLRLLP